MENEQGPDTKNRTAVTAEEITRVIDILSILNESPEAFTSLSKEQQIELMSAAGRISKPDHHQLKQRKKLLLKQKKQQRSVIERKARAATGIRKARESAVFTAPEQLRIAEDVPGDDPSLLLRSPRNCYVCKKEFTHLHHFYDSMCPDCAQLNYAKRFQRADLTGQVALITGSRLKIGYQATLMMLRSGATVIATTRFPVDSAARYAKEEDFGLWKDRLHIHGLDLRHTPSVEIFCSYIEQRYDRLDILINNAAQTVRRPPEFYAHLMEGEAALFSELTPDQQMLLAGHRDCTSALHTISGDAAGSAGDLPVSWKGDLPGIGIRESAKLSQIPYTYDSDAVPAERLFPSGKLDVDLQQVDLRKTNSWRLKLGEIQTGEMLELQLINSIAPFVLCNRLIPMMKRENTGQKHIVNVSAMEGKFMRFEKGSRHPHTNMAKAALNMLTHTAASELAADGIFMNAVDTGWVTDEDPVQLAKYKQEVHDFQPPLDIVDGAARVCDPFFDGINTGRHWCGKFLKDYFPIDW